MTSADSHARCAAVRTSPKAMCGWCAEINHRKLKVKRLLKMLVDFRN
jgi:hypothetical protein